MKTKKEILDVLDSTQAEYTVYAGKYTVVDMHDDKGDLIDISGIEEYTACSVQGGRQVYVVSLERPYDDEGDIADVLSFCDCYTGQ